MTVMCDQSYNAESPKQRRGRDNDGCSSNSRCNLAAAATLALGDVGPDCPSPNARMWMDGWMERRKCVRLDAAVSGAAAGREPYYGWMMKQARGEEAALAWRGGRL